MKPVEYIVTSEEMQQYDKNTVKQFHIPELLLMEQASFAAAWEIIRLFSSKKEQILVLAGTGNNGGDAMAVARILFLKGYHVTVCIISNKEICRDNFSESAKLQYDILNNIKVPIVTELPLYSYDIIVDGIFGVGLNRNITGKTENIIRTVNEWKSHKIALDIPSGICGTTGKVYGVAFQADFTITFAFIKRGLCLYPGAEYAGNIIKKEIGITEKSFGEKIPAMSAFCSDIKEYLPKRNPAGHKGTFGKILLIAGSASMGGAAILAGRAAMMSGCGMLRICTHKNHKTEILTTLPEAILDVYENEEEAVSCIIKGCAWADVIAMGPGMGTENISNTIWNTVIEANGKPLIMDADALNLLSISENYKKLYKKQNKRETKRTLILTPHPLELSRILGTDIRKQQEDILEIVDAEAAKLNAVIVKKDARTITCGGNHSYIINLCGNSGMATAGSGDVLTGIIAAVLAVCSKEPLQAAALGVYIHAKAGDFAKEQKNEYSIIAGDLCLALTEILKL